MKVIGLLGGMSWESTVPYYQVINGTVREQLGGLHSAKIVLFSVDFAEIEEMQVAGRWDEAGALLAKAAAAVDWAGADFLVICTNTMHIVADQIAKARTVGLLATKFTMEKDFYRSRIEANGFRVLVPDADDRLLVHRIIYDELCLGRIEETSRQEYRRGCTEIGLLAGPSDSSVPVFDTAAIHARAAAELAIKA